MYYINFIIKNSPLALSYTFKAYKSADDLFKRATASFKSDTVIDIEDDFDFKSTMDMSIVACITFSDYAKEMKKNGEVQILQAKADLQTQAAGRNDIGLRMLGEQANRVENGLLPGEAKILKAQ